MLGLFNAGILFSYFLTIRLEPNTFRPSFGIGEDAEHVVAFESIPELNSAWMGSELPSGLRG